MIAIGITAGTSAGGAIAGIIAVSAFIYQNPMRSERIYSWMHLEETRRDKGLQAYQAGIALASSGAGPHLATFCWLTGSARLAGR